MQTPPLRKNYEFSRVYRKGRYISGRHVVLHYLRRPGQPKRLGVTASRRVSNSVRRNRIKRLLRESFRDFEGQVRDGYDLILVGRHGKTVAGYHEVRSDVENAFVRAGLHKAKKKVDRS